MGNVFVADTGNGAIRKITSVGVVTTLVYDAALGTAGGIGGGSNTSFPQGIAVDAVGNVFVSDTLNYVIKKVTPAGVVTTVAGATFRRGWVDGTGAAARFNSDPKGVAVDKMGNAFVADTHNNRIRKITPAGIVTTLAGTTGGFADGIGAAAGFWELKGVAVDTEGNVFVGDSCRIRKITPAAVVTTLVGESTLCSSTDGTRDAARFNNIQSVAVD